MTEYGPTLSVSEETHKAKYRLEGESFREAMTRIANTLGEDQYETFRSILLNMRFLPAGRIQSSIGSPRRTTAFNCFVSSTIEDSMTGIMDTAARAAETMRLGGGIGYDFSTLRPKGDLIVSTDSRSSGPLSFMQIFDSICGTVAAAGHRRGAQMGVMRVDHPDIEEFIEAKTNAHNLTRFNLSIATTDEFMRCVLDDDMFDLVFEGRVYKQVNARYLFDKIMRATWDWAEPGMLFIDRIREMNNLNYCEEVAASNPCGEQPLPPNGACLLGSFNLVQYLYLDGEEYHFDWNLLKEDIPSVVRALDNVIDCTTYPLGEQKDEALAKRRMGIGYTGVANTGEALGFEYGSEGFLNWFNKVQNLVVNKAYQTSALLAEEKGTFLLYNHEHYTKLSPFVRRLSKKTRKMIEQHGLRNSHLISIAPTGTISLCADNVSSSIEPVFSHFYDRTIEKENGVSIDRVEDYGYANLGVVGKTADECTIDEHLAVLAAATKWSDSAVSKTINVGDDVTWEEFKDIYIKAWKLGCKGVTTFRAAGKRYGILNKVAEESSEGAACYYDASTGKKQCE